MSISLDLLKDTNSEAIAFGVYGGPGLNKTLAIRSLPGRVELHDFDGGTGCLMPWIRRKRRFDDPRWVEYTQADREHSFSLLNEVFRLDPQPDGSEGPNKYNPPEPVVDVISYDPLHIESYVKFAENLGNFQVKAYEGLVVDSLHELSQTTQSLAKNLKGKSTFDPMELSWWSGAQERAAIALRRLRGLRADGVFVYVTGAEEIEKEYANDPRSAPPGTKPDQPFSIKGSIQVPGKLVGAFGHNIDIMLHARTMNGKPTWVSTRETLTGGSGAVWETKDRFGRMDAYSAPNFKKILAQIYGKEGARAIYQRPTAGTVGSS